MDPYELIFAPRPERHRQCITLFIASHSSAEIADRFGNRPIDRALTLATLPERGRVVPELGDPAVREIKSYLIVYRLRARLVDVVRFWQTARGTPEIDSDEFRS